jgi:hypothetical protein
MTKKDHRSTILVYQRATYGEEKQIERQVKKNVLEKDNNTVVVPLWGSTLMHKDDLPF